MNIMSAMRAAGIAACVALLPTPALAGTLGDCVDSALPAETKLELGRKYVAGGMDALQGLPSEADVIGVAEQCLALGKGNEDQRIEQLSNMLSGYTLRRGAEAALAEKHRLDGPALQRAWAALTPPHRARFLKGGRADELAVEAMIAFIHAARPEIPATALRSLKDEEPGPELKPYIPLIEDLTAYAIGRGLMEAMGG